MAARPQPRTTAQQRYWRKRLAAPTFRRGLAALLADEIGALGRQRVGQVLDPRLVRELIAQWDVRVVDRAALAEVAIAANRRGARRLARRAESLVDLLDDALLDELDAAVTAQLELTPRAREFVATLMEREFVRGLFTDIIYTALVSFQRKINPLFGALTVRALEEQIKGFIRLFMPMLQAQATAFAVDPTNQRVVLDFARAVARQLLEVPIGRYAGLANGRGAGSPEALLRRAAANQALADLGRRAALAAWDDLFATLKTRRVGDLLHLDEQAPWLAARAVDLVLPVLRRDGVVAFIAAEVDAASIARR